MKSPRKYRNGPAVGIVSGIADELVVEGKRRPFVEAVGVVRFEDLFPLVVKLSVANQDTQTAGSEIRAGLRRETFDDTRDTDFVVRPSPSCSGQNRAEGKALTAIRPTHNFGSSRTPRRAREYAEIGGDRLLDIGDKAVIGPGAAGQRDIGMVRTCLLYTSDAADE